MGREGWGKEGLRPREVDVFENKLSKFLSISHICAEIPRWSLQFAIIIFFLEFPFLVPNTRPMLSKFSVEFQGVPRISPPPYLEENKDRCINYKCVDSALHKKHLGLFNIKF